MSAKDFWALVEEGNLLQYLIFGHPDMRDCLEPQFDVFKKFDVTAEVLCVIQACIRSGGVLPEDTRACFKADLGELREAADRLGGFELVDAALSRYHAEKKKDKSLLRTSKECTNGA